MVHTKRYFRSLATSPLISTGHTSTLRAWPVFKLKTSTMPPTLPEPDALDQMMLLSTGSGVAQPLSPPAIPIQVLRGIGAPKPPPPPPPPPPKPPPPPVRLGPRYDGPS